MLRKCCCRPLYIAIVHSWSSLHRGLGPAWRAAWLRIQRELRSLPVRWTTAIDFSGMNNLRMGVAPAVLNWRQDLAAHAPFRLDDGRTIDPASRDKNRYVISLAKPLDACAPPDLASAPDSWPNLDALSNCHIPNYYDANMYLGSDLFPAPARPNDWGERAIVAFGGGVSRTMFWPNGGTINASTGEVITPPTPTLDPPCVAVWGSGTLGESFTTNYLVQARCHLYAMNPGAVREAYDDSLEYVDFNGQPRPRPGYATRIAAATDGWASHDWGQFADVGRILDELRKIVAAMRERRGA